MIILTGASGGIGKDLACELEKTDTVIGTYNRNKTARGASYKVDVADEKSVSRFVMKISASLKRITLVNLAGVTVNSPTHDLALARWEGVISVNLTGAFLMAKHLLPYMMKERWGRIINISSIASNTALRGTAAYAASKAGLIGLTKALAKEYAPYNICVNCISLGCFSSGMIRTIPAQKVEILKQYIPLRRLGNAGDVAAAIRFLIDCDYITGAVVDLTGGLD